MPTRSKTAPPRRQYKNPHAVALGRLGGHASASSPSAAKQRAARENGKKGGRPWKNE